MKSRVFKWLVLAATLISLVFVVPSATAGKPDKPPKEDPVFTAVSDSPVIAEIISHSADKGGQIVFRHTNLDLGEFEGTWDSGGSCFHNSDLRDEPFQGIMVLSPKSRKAPAVAQLLYWFQSRLESGGDPVTHKFVMEGIFDEQDNWPPEVGSTTSLSFYSWEVIAENKWAQRQDCSGDGGVTSDPWQVFVTRQE